MIGLIAAAAAVIAGEGTVSRWPIGPREQAGEIVAFTTGEHGRVREVIRAEEDVASDGHGK